VGSEEFSAYGAVASRKSQEKSPAATLLVIGVLVYWGRLRRYLSNISALIKKMALQSNAYQNYSLLTLNSSLQKQRKPKPFTKILPTTHYPLPTLSRKVIS